MGYSSLISCEKGFCKNVSEIYECTYKDRLVFKIMAKNVCITLVVGPLSFPFSWALSSLISTIKRNILRLSFVLSNTIRDERGIISIQTVPGQHFFKPNSRKLQFKPPGFTSFRKHAQTLILSVKSQSFWPHKQKVVKRPIFLFAII